MSGRLHKSILNAEVNLIFYFLSLFLAFFSRKIFLDCLGTEFIGLTGTLGNILGYLNLAELGITASIGYFLFKPLQTNNRHEVQEVMSLLGYLYNWIGGIIGAGGFLITTYQDEIAEYFEEDKDLVVVRTPDEFIEKTAYYLEHEDERKEIAVNGQKKAFEKFAYTKLLPEVLTL